MSKGLLRKKRAELQLALEGRVTEHHRFLLRQLMRHLRFTEERMDDVEEEIARRMAPHQEDVHRLCTIPGVDRATAWGLLAENEFHMDHFLRRRIWRPGRGFAPVISRAQAND